MATGQQLTAPDYSLRAMVCKPANQADTQRERRQEVDGCAGHPANRRVTSWRRNSILPYRKLTTA